MASGGFSSLTPNASSMSPVSDFLQFCLFLFFKADVLKHYFLGMVNLKVSMATVHFLEVTIKSLNIVFMASSNVNRGCFSAATVYTFEFQR